MKGFAVLLLALAACGPGAAADAFVWPGVVEGGPRTAIDSDGTWLYYESGAPRILAATDDGRIVLLAEDGTELDELGTLNPEDASNGFAVSTDGRFAYFDRGRRSACDAEVVRLNLDTGRVRTIAAGGQPALSPDGRRLAYVGCGEDSDTENRVFVRRLRSAKEQSIDVEGALLVSRPSWAPDSRLLAVEVSAGGVAEIHVMDPRSSENRVVMLESTENTFWRGYRGATGEFYALTAPGGEAGSGSLLPVITIDPETGATLGTLFELDAQCCPIDLATDREGTAILAAGTNAGLVVWREGAGAPQPIAPAIRKAAWVNDG